MVVAAEPPGLQPARPAVLALTMARDEGRMLARWVQHYGAHLGVDHLLVIDDGSRDGSTDDLPCPVLRTPGLRRSGFNGPRLQMINRLAAGLLESYDAVLFTDTDEFLLPDPAHHPDLRSYLRARPGVPVMAPIALNLLHHVPSEPALRHDEPVLGQRALCQLAPNMCKPSIKRRRAPWAAATHGIRARYEVDPELFMVHLKFGDVDRLRAVGAHRHELTRTEGRGGGSSWRLGPDELVELLLDVTRDVDPSTLPELDPAEVDVETLVMREEKLWRSPRVPQVHALRSQPLLRVPQRLRGLL